MPEYLAPGVYVEETSFRSKSIEGVSTSTSAFAGPARKGPIGGKPVFVTSFAEFERIYGGFASLGVGVNYLAHSVRAYFDNGGARLYISRVYSGKPEDGVATSATLSPAGQPARGLSFKARFPGSGLNGAIQLELRSTPANKPSLERAPAGTLVRTGTGQLATAATMEGAPAPFYIDTDAKLTFRVGGANADSSITFAGTSAEVTAQDALAANLSLTATDNTLTVTLAGIEQTITFPVGAITPAAILDTLNVSLRGGYAKIAANKIVIGCDKRGRASSVAVKVSAKFGFTADLSASNTAQAAMLNDLNAVTIQEINTLLDTGNSRLRATTTANGRLLLSTVDTGETATFTLQAAGAAAKSLGLTTGQAATGKKGATPKLYLKANNSYRDAQNQALDLDSTPAEILTITVVAEDADGSLTPYDNLAFGSEHPRYLGGILTKSPTRRADEISAPYYADILPNTTAFELFDVLFSGSPAQRLTLSAGKDGAEPDAESYKAALAVLEAYDDISIVATPGGSSYSGFQAITDALITHCAVPRRYRVAVVDTPKGYNADEARDLRGKFDSTRAAMYFPWVVVANPLFRPGADDQPRELLLPPSGFVSGIYARNDIERSVAKSPANEIVRGALRFESDINFATQEVLNPLGVNCLRALTGRGYRVWGSRTMSSDPEWKYLNVRRYFHFLEASIERGTQWAVFENNGERLWENIRETISGFLYNEWVSGNLLGESPEQAYFVRCDRTTMTQNDLDNGRLICLIGVAALKPAEFVIFRIGQKTVDSND